MGFVLAELDSEVGELWEGLGGILVSVSDCLRAFLVAIVDWMDKGGGLEMRIAGRGMGYMAEEGVCGRFFACSSFISARNID